MAEPSRSMSQLGYIKYILVAGVVGVITIALRYIIGLLLGEDTAMNYAISGLCAYACGVSLSYFGQSRFTFRHTANTQSSLRRFVGFVLISISTSLLAVLLSNLLRYQLGFDMIFGLLSPDIAFAFAVLLTSLISYSLNAVFIFKNSNN